MGSGLATVSFAVLSMALRSQVSAHISWSPRDDRLVQHCSLEPEDRHRSRCAALQADTARRKHGIWKCPASARAWSCQCMVSHGSAHKQHMGALSAPVQQGPVHSVPERAQTYMSRGGQCTGPRLPPAGCSLKTCPCLHRRTQGRRTRDSTACSGRSSRDRGQAPGMTPMARLRSIKGIKRICADIRRPLCQWSAGPVPPTCVFSTLSLVRTCRRQLFYSFPDHARGPYS